jgi:1-deoxy-D-xylulose-5-phosphate reductoisomerase
LLSGANEIAVEAFLERRIPWLAIADVNGGVLSDETWGTAGSGNVRDVDDVLEADRVARARARLAVDRISATTGALT